MNRAAVSYLIPVRELPQGSVAKIRNEAIEQVVAMVAAELKKSPEELVVRDIRPQADLDWCSDATIFSAALTVESWTPTLDSSDAYAAYHSIITSASQVMADNRWVVITGVKDFRLNEATAVKKVINFLKIQVGGNDRVLWDLESMEGYANAMAAITPSPVVIPQNVAFDIEFGHFESDDGNVASDVVVYLVLDGFVVEPRGKILSP